MTLQLCYFPLNECQYIQHKLVNNISLLLLAHNSSRSLSALFLSIRTPPITPRYRSVLLIFWKVLPYLKVYQCENHYDSSNWNFRYGLIWKFSSLTLCMTRQTPHTILMLYRFPGQMCRFHGIKWLLPIYSLKWIVKLILCVDLMCVCESQKWNAKTYY